MANKKAKLGERVVSLIFAPIVLGYFTVIVATAVTVAISWVLYIHTVSILTQNLRQRLIGIVSTAAVQFDPEDLQILNVEKDVARPEWKKVVTQLINIRNSNEDIVFAYIL